MTTNFARDWKVIVGTTEIVGLRIVFKVKKTSKPDPATLDLSIYNLSAATRAALGTGGPAAATLTVRIGSSGFTVTEVQTALQAAGFSPGTIDGKFGSATDSAVRSFQASRGLAVDGIVGDESRRALGLATSSVRQPVILMAGYKGSAGVIFAGPARTIDQVRDGADWKTHILCGDGEQSYDGVSSFSFAGGVRKGDVLLRLTEDMKQFGVNVGDAQRRIRKADIAGFAEVFTHGYAACGRTMKEMGRLAAATRIEFSIQSGSLVIAEPGKPATEEAIVLSPETGMIGSPDHSAPKKNAEETAITSLLKIRSLLNGELRPMRALRVESSTRTGDYRVEIVEHSGDSHGADWTTQVEARPL